jgi:hypothetical protein
MALTKGTASNGYQTSNASTALETLFEATSLNPGLRAIFIKSKSSNTVDYRVRVTGLHYDNAFYHLAPGEDITFALPDASEVGSIIKVEGSPVSATASEIKWTVIAR